MSERQAEQPNDATQPLEGLNEVLSRGFDAQRPEQGR